MTLTRQRVNSVRHSLHWMFSTTRMLPTGILRLDVTRHFVMFIKIRCTHLINCNPGNKEKWVLVVQEHPILLPKRQLYLFPCTPLRWVIWFLVDLSCSVWLLFATHVYQQEQLHVYRVTSSKHSRLLWLQHLAIDKVLKDKIICLKHVYCKSNWHITRLLIKTKVFFSCQSKWVRANAWNFSFVISL